MNALTVTQLTNKIKNIVEPNFLNVAVEGEISNFYLHISSGHIYFTLKDVNSAVSVVLFKSYAQRLKFDLKNGMKIVVCGNITIFEPRGEYKLRAENIIPAGLGLLQLEFEKLKEKLRLAGWFDEARKKKIPAIPENIGIITSEGGAALQDILNTIKRRFPKINIFIYPVTVQGETAKFEIAAAFKYFEDNPIVDVIILARGGGSIEDLWAFNEELTATAIYNCNIPVITGVGHETDFTIADMVADLRAPTPTAAAELAVPDYTELLARLNIFQERFNSALKSKTSMLRQKINLISKSRVFLKPADRIDKFKILTDDYRIRMFNSLTSKHSFYKRIVDAINLDAKFKILLARKKTQTEQFQKIVNIHFKNKTTFVKNKLTEMQSLINNAIIRTLTLKKNNIQTLMNNFIHLNPLNIIKRGYAAVFDETNKSVTGIKNICVNDKLKVQFNDGLATCEVKNIKEKSLF